MRGLRLRRNLQSANGRFNVACVRSPHPTGRLWIKYARIWHCCIFPGQPSALPTLRSCSVSRSRVHSREPFGVGRARHLITSDRLEPPATCQRAKNYPITVSCTPISDTYTRKGSPAHSHCGGVRNAPMPAGIPVPIMSSGSWVMKCVM
jgi:hypothetical protein